MPCPAPCESEIYAAVWRDFCQHTPDLLFIKDLDLAYRGASIAFARTLGYDDPAALLGKTDPELCGNGEAAAGLQEEERLLLTGGPAATARSAFPAGRPGRRRYAAIEKHVIYGADGQAVGLYGVGRDITEQAALEREKSLLAVDADHDLDQAYRQAAGLNCYSTAVVNLTRQRMEALFSLDQEEMEANRNCNPEHFFRRAAEQAVDDQAVRHYFLSVTPHSMEERLARGQDRLCFEYRCRFGDGSRRWVRYEARLQRDPVRNDLMLYQYIKDIDEEKRRIDALTKAAETDAMTGFYNHGATLEQIRRYLQGEGAAGRHVLFMVDIDHFKEVNDTLGHQQGDDMIAKIAAGIRGLFRSTDILGRVGGDEFLVLMKNVDNRGMVRKRAEELVEALQFVCSSAASTIQLSGSVGVSLYDGDRKTVEELYAEADAALYRAKNAGKNRYALPENAGLPPAAPADVSSAIQLRTLLEHMDGGVVVVEVTDSLRITYVSPSFYKMMRRSPEETGKDLLALVCPEDRPALEQALFQAAGSNELIDHVYRAVGPEGRIGWRHLRALRMPDSVGAPRRIIGLVTDITALKRSAARLEAIIRDSPVGVALFERGDQYRLLLANDELVRLSGLCRAEYEARYTVDCMRIVLEEDRPLIEQALEEAAQERRPADCAFRYVSPATGDLRWLTARVIHLEDNAQGRPLFLANILDITKQRQAAQEIRLEQERYRLALRLTGWLIWEVDIPSRTLYHQQELAQAPGGGGGVFPNAPESILAMDIIHPDSHGECRRLFDDLYAGREGRGYTLLIRDRRGGYTWIKSRFLLMRDEGGQPQGALGVSEPIANVEAEMRCFEREQRFAELIQPCLWGALRVNLSKNFVESLHLPEAMLPAGRCFETYDELFAAFRERMGEPCLDLEALGREKLLAAYGEGRRLLSVNYPQQQAGGARWISVMANLLRHPVSGDLYAFAYCQDLGLRRQAECLPADAAELDPVTLAYSGTAAKALFRRLLSQAKAEDLCAMTVIKLGGLERLRRKRGTEAANETLQKYAWLCRIFAGGDTAAGRLDDARFVLFRVNACSGQEQQLLTAKIRNQVNAAARQVLADGELELAFGFAMEQAAESRWETLLKKAATACSVAERWSRSPVAGYIEPSPAGRKSQPAPGPFPPGRLRHHAERRDNPRAKTRQAGEQPRFRKQANILPPADYDDLTGLYNRQALYRLVRQRLRQHPGTRYLLLCFAIDRFAEFTALLGAVAGDQLLKELGALLISQSAGDRIFARLEAAQFACFLPLADSDADSFCQTLGEWLEHHDPHFRLSCSAGAYIVDEPDMGVPLICDRALLALCAAKKNSGLRLAYYDDSLRLKLRIEQRLAGDMANALAEKQFRLYYQPQYNQFSGEIVGAEALVRWAHPEQGLLTPGQFIPLFENNGFITQMDRYVWEQACAFQQQRLAAGRKTVPVAVNISRRDFDDQPLSNCLSGLLNKYGLSAALLRLEMAENAYSDDPEQALFTIRQLREQGFCVGIDDFGSGLSSLNTLKKVPMDLLKLDMKFMNGDECAVGRSCVILDSVLGMAQVLNLPVIAEEVETPRQARYLHSLGCRFIQGFLFGKPMPEAEFTVLLEQGTIGRLSGGVS